MGGGNSLIINELDQKPSNFTEDLLKKYSSGSLKGFATAFLFSDRLQPNNKLSLTFLKTIQKMKKTTKLKALALSVMMLACILVPTSAFAQQKSDDFFRDSDNFNGNRIDDLTAWTFTFGAQNFGQEAPLGTGLLIMLSAGAGYAILKKKED